MTNLLTFYAALDSKLDASDLDFFEVHEATNLPCLHEGRSNDHAMRRADRRQEHPDLPLTIRLPAKTPFQRRPKRIHGKKNKSQADAR